MSTDHGLTALASRLRDARAVVVLTGAGVSAESGTPTFRDAMTGLWASFSPEDLATPEAFQRNPAMVSRWYDERRLGCLACLPNPGHFALAEIERRLSARASRFTLLTQNVDRLHQRAGSRNVVELHGTLMTWRCTRTGRSITPPPTPFSEYPPRSDAGAPLRPDVVWFGEMLPDEALQTAHHVLSTCDLFLSVGTSGVVYPAAGFVHIANQNGAVTGEINLEPSAISRSVDWSIRGRSGHVLPQLLEAAFGGHNPSATAI